jgi:cytochrome P450
MVAGEGTRTTEERRMTGVTSHHETGVETAVEASIPDTLRVAFQVVVPILATGVIKRRPKAMALADRLQADRPAIRLLRRLRRKYGAVPLRLRVPGRSVTIPLSRTGVGELLDRTPDPFSPATKEKKAALRHFQPHGVLISGGERRAGRRDFVERVLEPERPLHELAAPWARVIAEETTRLTASAAREGILDWDTFNEHWWNVVRGVVFGSNEAEDRELTDLLGTLRLDGNWAYLHPRRENDRARFFELLHARVKAAGPGSLAAKLVTSPARDGVDPVGQIPHWLFAFDAAGMATARALALLATHPEQGERARDELAALDLGEPRQLEYHRACVLESVRLWPTTPALLRESRADTPSGRAGTTFFVYTPFFHRDSENLAYADRFEPEIWLDGRAEADPALVPFSGGPGVCPGRSLVLYTTGMMLANLWQGHDYELRSPSTLDSSRPVPVTQDNFGLEFGVTAR